jgi:hypothetical protein
VGRVFIYIYGRKTGIGFGFLAAECLIRSGGGQSQSFYFIFKTEC